MKALQNLAPRIHLRLVATTNSPTHGRKHVWTRANTSYIIYMYMRLGSLEHEPMRSYLRVRMSVPGRSACKTDPRRFRCGWWQPQIHQYTDATTCTYMRMCTHTPLNHSSSNLSPNMCMHYVNIPGRIPYQTGRREFHCGWLQPFLTACACMYTRCSSHFYALICVCTYVRSRTKPLRNHPS